MKTILQQSQINKLQEFGIDAVRFDDLLAILPKKITDRMTIYELKIWIDHYSDAWCIEYERYDDPCDVLDSFQSADELIDAVYDMICWLKDNPQLKWL